MLRTAAVRGFQAGSRPNTAIHAKLQRLALQPTRLAATGRRSLAVHAAQMIQEGDKLPGNIKLQKDVDGNKQDTTVGEVTKGKVVLVGVPGAFTPVCSSSHIPGFVKETDKFKQKGINYIGVISTNDIFVMRAWGETLGIKNSNVNMLSDGNGELIKAIGLDVDMSGNVMGTRTRRFAMCVEDGVVKKVFAQMDDGGGSGSDDVTSATHLLQKLE